MYYKKTHYRCGKSPIFLSVLNFSTCIVETVQNIPIILRIGFWTVVEYFLCTKPWSSKNSILTWLYSGFKVAFSVLLLHANDVQFIFELSLYQRYISKFRHRQWCSLQRKRFKKHFPGYSSISLFLKQIKKNILGRKSLQ